MSEPTTLHAAISRTLSDIARFVPTRGAAELNDQAVKLGAHVNAGWVNEWSGDLNRWATTVNGLASDAGYARGATITLFHLAPFLDIPTELIERASRGDGLASIDYARYVKGEWSPNETAA